MDVTISPTRKLRGKLVIPGDKSISHRAVMFGAIAAGTTEISGFLPGQDCLSTVACMRQLGIEIEDLGQGKLKVYGKGLGGLQEPANVLDVGNSGTTIRLLLGIMAGQPFFSVFNGDETIRRRPMGRVTKPLMQMGAEISGRNDGNLAPLALCGGNLRAIDYTSPVASAQVKSAVLLAGLYASGTTSVSEPYTSRDHTERMLKAFGARIQVSGSKVAVDSSPSLKGQQVHIPGDISSAAFWMVAGSIVPEAELLLENVGLNPTRDGILEALTAMGASITVSNKREVSGEPVGDLLIKPALLRGISIGGSLIPRLIDEIPILAVAAAFAQGVTEIRDAAELKVKETNRITAVARELGRMGAQVEELPDGLRITGGKPLTGGTVETYHDHRMAMSLAVAGLRAEGPTLVKNAEVASVSYPEFFSELERLRH